MYLCRNAGTSKVEHGIIQNSGEAISADAAADQRAHAVLDAAQLAEKTGRLKVEIQELAEDSVRYHGDLDAYRANHPPMG